MDNGTTLRITVTPDKAGTLRARNAATHAFGGAVAQLDPAVRDELAALEPAVLRFLRADPKNAQAFAQDPVGTLRDKLKLSPRAVAAVIAARAQSEKQYPGVPGVRLERIAVTVADEA